ncbi:MAG: RNA methyltransferase [Candidatus Magasanikbacteria bacterium]
MKRQVSLILPNIRSCHNVGAMFRTADAFGIEKLYLVGYTAHPPKVQIDKVSLGAEKWIPWEGREDIFELLSELKENGYQIIALEKTPESEDIRNVQFGEKVALIVGNEVDGVTEDILQKVDTVIHIPMCGKKESLNVSIATGIALYMVSGI